MQGVESIVANFFGIRHFSPACSYYVQEFLDRTAPELVLIEGPSDLNDLIAPLCSEDAVPPVAILAYTDEAPVQTVLWPFAEFSPEYQAMLWANRHNVPVQFCDLPAKVNLALRKVQEEKKQQEESQTEKQEESVYQQLEKHLGISVDSFWEYNFEYNNDYEDFQKAVVQYGEHLREFSKKSQYNEIREAYMRKVISEAVKEGIATEKIAVITGAFHTGGIQEDGNSKEAEELLQNLPEISSKATLMPYSYYRLSSRSGYGAGSKAPGYYEILWKNRLAGKQENSSAEYLTSLAKFQREKGYGTSSAEVIEALRLTKVLAGLRNGKGASLEDLRDAAITCMGHGSFGEISMACADTEIGTKIGKLPEGTVCTSLQEDFKRQLKELKMEKYFSAVLEELELDLRENLRVKSEKSAFLDLNRSFFLQRMKVLGIHFCKQLERKQDNATWAELWALQWNPEVEIEIVEASLKGDTILQAAEFELRKQLAESDNLPKTAKILSEAFLCGIPNVVHTAVYAVQNMATNCTGVREIGVTIGTLSDIIRFGNIRRLETDALIPLMETLFLRFCLEIGNEVVCDKSASDEITHGMELVNSACLSHEFLKEENWIQLLLDLADRDFINMRISGFATAILVERGKMSNETLAELISRRLSKGTPAAEGAGWFEGLAMKNRRSLISRFSLWEKLFEYVSELDEEEFKAALVCLRRTFGVFTPSEKTDIAENIGEILGISKESAAEFIATSISAVEQQAIEDLDDFDFGDI